MENDGTQRGVLQPGSRSSRYALPVLWLTLCVATAGCGTPTRETETKVPKKTAFVYHAIFLEHDTGAGHPERAARLKAIGDRLAESGVQAELVALTPAPASV